MVKLSIEQIGKALEDLENWNYEDNSIYREFLFTTFTEAMFFVNTVAAIAQAQEHYPDIDIRGKKVIITLTTQGVTEKDIKMAKKIHNIIDVIK